MERILPNLQSVLPTIYSVIQTLELLPPLVHPKESEATELGWVVHRTLPMNLPDNTTEEELDDAIKAYYEDEWTEVRRDIELTMGSYLIDHDSKEIMEQALQAHEGRLYRLPPLALLPAIERAVRVNMKQELVGRSFNIKENILNGIDNLPWFSISSAAMQKETLENHLYQQVENETERAQFAENHIPNRNAAIHGLVAYSSAKSSLNSIFLADCVFHIVTEMKKQEMREMTRILRNYILATEQNR